MFAFDRKPESLLLYSGLSLTLLWGLITWISHGIAISWLPESWQAGFAFEVENDLTPTASFLVLYGLNWGVLLFVLNRYRLAKQISRRASLGIVGIAILIRLIAVFGEPIHENDFYRYLWDGQVSISGVNPYRFSPDMTGDSIILSGLQAENPDFHARIGHPAIPTIYPPLAQLVFAVSAALFGWSVIGFKAIILCFDLGVVFLLIALLRKLDRNPLWVILYAWNPLVIKEFANSAHYDAVPVFFCLLALLIVVGPNSSLRKSVLTGFVIALGTMAKYFPILLLPVLLIALAGGKRTSQVWKSSELWIGTSAFIATMIVGFVPFLLWDDVGIKGVFSGLQTYGERWQYSPGIFALLERSLAYGGWDTHFVFAKVVVAVFLTGLVIWIALRPVRDVQHLAEKCFFVISALFVLSPTAFPWYYCWVLAFLVFKPRFSWLLLGALLPLNYLDFHSAESIPFAHAHWAGFFLIPTGIWFIFALAWFGERHFLKSS